MTQKIYKEILKLSVPLEIEYYQIHNDYNELNDVWVARWGVCYEHGNTSEIAIEKLRNMINKRINAGKIYLTDTSDKDPQ